MLQHGGDCGLDKEGCTYRHASNRQEGDKGVPRNLLRCMHKLIKKFHHISNVWASNS